jgi:hypothetical protein
MSFMQILMGSPPVYFLLCECFFLTPFVSQKLTVIPCCPSKYIRLREACVHKYVTFHVYVATHVFHRLSRM